MKTGFLPKSHMSTDDGSFTVLPNQVVDSILSYNKCDCKISDILALALILLRFLPGQKGSVKLTNEFNKQSLLELLGWGTTNFKRLQKALRALEAIGLIEIGLHNNNLITLEINASITQNKHSDKKVLNKETNVIPLKSKTTLAVNIEKTPTTIEESYTEGTEENSTPIYINNNENKIINNHHDDLKKNEASELINRFQELFEQPVNSWQRQQFTKEYVSQKLTKDRLLYWLEKLAAHPYTFKTVTSINALFHAKFLFASSAITHFEKTAKDLVQNCHPDELKQIVEGQGFDFVKFTNTYF